MCKRDYAMSIYFHKDISKKQHRTMLKYVSYEGQTLKDKWKIKRVSKEIVKM